MGPLSRWLDGVGRASPEEQIHIYQVDNGQLHAWEAEGLRAFNLGVWILRQSRSGIKGSKCLGLLVLNPLWKAGEAAAGCLSRLETPSQM